jgi:hypothetical protein
MLMCGAVPSLCGWNLREQAAGANRVGTADGAGWDRASSRSAPRHSVPLLEALASDDVLDGFKAVPDSGPIVQFAALGLGHLRKVVEQLTGGPHAAI